MLPPQVRIATFLTCDAAQRRIPVSFKKPVPLRCNINFPHEQNKIFTLICLKSTPNPSVCIGSGNNREQSGRLSPGRYGARRIVINEILVDPNSALSFETDGLSLQRASDGADILTIDTPTAGVTNVCFTGGTLLATPREERAEDDLHVGDLILTGDTGPQPVTWL